jgi:geranylgeranyl diphosphate synthase, type II
MTEKPKLIIPSSVPVRDYRQPEKNLPQTRGDRERVRRSCRKFVLNNSVVPPVPAMEIRVHAKTILDDLEMSHDYVEFTGIILNNELWREQMAAIPYERRLLLLSKCMRIEEQCPAPFDEFGLLCKNCGLCSIQDIQEEAEKLGYAVLVAEGSTLVMKIIETGQIEAIVGVSCISVLEKAFPYMEAAAIPGMAIPLLQSDCKDTTVDEDWIWEAIHLNASDKTRRLDLETIRERIAEVFTIEGLNTLLGTSSGPVAEYGRQSLAQAGKRWRPFLTIATAVALNPELADLSEYPKDLLKLAVAVECFHKASLIHDDIEDEDDSRYGEPTLHKKIGMPAAINVGDWLVGEGYRIIASTDVEPLVKAQMVMLAAEGHTTLAAGQGQELEWRRNPGPIPQKEILALFRDKTAPAFDVAIRMGGYYGSADDKTLLVMERFSENLGIAYQVNDDMDDFSESTEGSDIRRDRPSLVLSIAYKDAKAQHKEMIDKWWSNDKSINAQDVQWVVLKGNAETRMIQLKESYKQAAINSLSELEDASIKGLLRRVVTKIFNDVEIKGWCREFEITDASGDGAVETSSK